MGYKYKRHCPLQMGNDPGKWTLKKRTFSKFGQNVLFSLERGRNEMRTFTVPYTAQKRFSIEDFFITYDQISSFLRIWSHLIKKSLKVH